MISPTGASQSQSGVTMRKCSPSSVVWMPVISRRSRQSRAAQGQPKQAEERGRQEEARVPLVVAGRSAGFVDLALLEGVEHRVQAVLERLLVGRGVVRAARDLRDLLQRLGGHVDLDRLVRVAA